ncbi:MAG: intradiol ring-cleavage dioxygenase [Cyclobacteriaceae bacterium]|nr:intradiol ring-cleavage dioxygenase [Cyclobacteriaceae bacterium]
MQRNEFLKRLGFSTLAPVLLACDSAGDEILNSDTTANDGTTGTCTTTHSETAGPYPTKNPSSLQMVDIRSDRTGVDMTVEITIQNKNTNCAPLQGAIVDIWHCDKDGNYSEYSSFSAVHFLRGRQVTDSSGKVGFKTIFPGWYNGRATHIHVHIYSSSGTSLLVTQIAFPEGSSSAVALVNAATAKGYTKGMSGYTYNSSDNVFSDGVSTELAFISGSVNDGYTLTHTIVVNG